MRGEKSGGRGAVALARPCFVFGHLEGEEVGLLRWREAAGNRGGALRERVRGELDCVPGGLVPGLARGQVVKRARKAGQLPGPEGGYRLTRATGRNA